VICCNSFFINIYEFVCICCIKLHQVSSSIDLKAQSVNKFGSFHRIILSPQVSALLEDAKNLCGFDPYPEVPRSVCVKMGIPLRSYVLSSLNLTYRNCHKWSLYHMFTLTHRIYTPLNPTIPWNHRCIPPNLTTTPLHSIKSNQIHYIILSYWDNPINVPLMRQMIRSMF